MAYGAGAYGVQRPTGFGGTTNTPARPPSFDEFTRTRMQNQGLGVPSAPTYTSAPGVRGNPDLVRPQWELSPLGDVRQYNYDQGMWSNAGNIHDYDRARQRTQDEALGMLRNQVMGGLTRGGGGSVSRVPAITAEQSGSNEPYDRAAESAIYGRAKERTGQAMQAALKGLQSQMAQRGITGSGIEGDKTTELFGAGLGELSDIDAQMAHEAAGRAFQGEQLNVDRRGRTNEFNAGLEQWYQDAQQRAMQQRMSTLASFGASLY